MAVLIIGLKSASNAKIEELENKFSNLSDKHSEINNLLQSALKRVSNLDLLLKKGTVEEKRQIISSTFPENIVFDGERYRTMRVNAETLLIYQKKSELETKKKSQIVKKRLGSFCAPNGTKLELFAGGFEKIGCAVFGLN